MTEKAKTILIGCFIIIACLATIGVLLFLRPSVGDGKKKLYVCFTSIEKIQIGTRVTFAGQAVGEVIAIDPIYDARSQPTGRYGHVCFYELELAIDSHTVVYDTDEVTVHTTGLLGERTIAIIPRAVKKGQPSYPVTDQIMYGKSGDPVEEMLNQLSSIGNKAGETFDQLREILQQNKAEIPHVLKSIREAAFQIRTSFATINASHVIENLNETIHSIKETSKRFDIFLGAINEKEVVSSLSKIAKNISEITDAINRPEDLQTIVSNIREVSNSAKEHFPTILQDFRRIACNVSNFSSSMSPTGSIGKLFKNDEFYLQVTNLMSKANILLADVNNYGVLFHLNKTWQRERMIRMNLLSKLRCPEAFTLFFDEEMNRITLSLSRIEMSLRKAACSRNCNAIFDNKEFNSDFSELLQRLNDVEETLQIYRQQFIESRLRCNSSICVP
ncbi:MAG: MlaD family protein [Chlamydiales bacterium]|nr:MlaD family protein [Chlamydiales bacterium]